MARQAPQHPPFPSGDQGPIDHGRGDHNGDSFADTTIPCDDAMLASLLAQARGQPTSDEPTRVLGNVASIPVGGAFPAHRTDDAILLGALCAAGEPGRDDAEIITSDEACTTYWYGTPPPDLVDAHPAAERKSAARKPQRTTRSSLGLTVCTGLWTGLLLALMILPGVSEQIWHEMMVLWRLLGR